MASHRKIETAPRKKAYSKPSLQRYGKLKDLTNGGSGRAAEPSNGKKPRP